jgi:hypothetical protein
MAFILSTGARQAMLGIQDGLSGTGLSCIDDDASGGRITTSDGNFMTAGFRPGDTIALTGWGGTIGTAGTCGTSNNMIVAVSNVAVGTMGVTPRIYTQAGSGGSTSGPTLTAVAKSFKDMFRNNIIRIYSGAAPATADATESGVLLLKLTKSSGAFVAGSSANGNNFGTAAAGVLPKDGNVCSGVGLADGVAGYYRMYDNGEITGASTVAKRVQGVCALSGGEFTLSSTTITTGATVTLDIHNITLPSGA